MGIRDTYPILARKTQLGGPAPRKYTVNADEFDLLVDLVDTLTSAVVSATGITALTGDASAAGTGTVVATVNQARGLRETAGPTTLTMGAVADGEMLIRDGATVRGEPVPTGSALPADVISLSNGTATITQARTIVQLVQGDEFILVKLPLASEAEGFTVDLRSTAGSDGWKAYFAFAAGDSFEGVAVALDAIGDLSGIELVTGYESYEGYAIEIPGSEAAAGDLSSVYHRPLKTWAIYSDGTSWRWAPGTPPVRDLTYSGVPGATAPTSKNVADGFGHGSLFAGVFRDNGGSPGTVRGWIALGVDDSGNAMWAPIGFTPVITVTSTSYNLPLYDAVILVDSDTAGGDVTLTAPANGTAGNAGNNTGRQYLIIKISTDTNLITFARASGVLVEGVDSDYELPNSGDPAIGRWHAVSSGTDWYVG